MSRVGCKDGSVWVIWDEGDGDAAPEQAIAVATYPGSGMIEIEGATGIVPIPPRMVPELLRTLRAAVGVLEGGK